MIILGPVQRDNLLCSWLLPTKNKIEGKNKKKETKKRKEKKMRGPRCQEEGVGKTNRRGTHVHGFWLHSIGLHHNSLSHKCMKYCKTSNTGPGSCEHLFNFVITCLLIENTETTTILFYGSTQFKKHLSYSKSLEHSVGRIALEVPKKFTPQMRICHAPILTKMSHISPKGFLMLFTLLLWNCFISPRFCLHFL